MLFKCRAKLFRFDDDEKEWKEKGLGDYKISYSEEHGIYRVVMQSEEVT